MIRNLFTPPHLGRIKGICFWHFDFQHKSAALVGRVRWPGNLASQLCPAVVDELNLDGTLNNLE